MKTIDQSVKQVIAEQTPNCREDIPPVVDQAQAHQLAERQAYPTLTADQVALLYDHARRTGQRVTVNAEDGSYC